MTCVCLHRRKQLARLLEAQINGIDERMQILPGRSAHVCSRGAALQCGTVVLRARNPRWRQRVHGNAVLCLACQRFRRSARGRCSLQGAQARLQSARRARTQFHPVWRKVCARKRTSIACSVAVTSLSRELISALASSASLSRESAADGCAGAERSNAEDVTYWPASRVRSGPASNTGATLRAACARTTWLRTAVPGSTSTFTGGSVTRSGGGAGAGATRARCAVLSSSCSRRRSQRLERESCSAR